MSFSDFVRTRIFAPLGMRASVVHVEDRTRCRTVPSAIHPRWLVRANGPERHQRDAGRRRHLHERGRHDALGSALDGTALVDSATMALATTPPQLPANAATEYGFGWFVDTYRGEKRWRHTGETSGFHNAIMRFPGRRLTVIVLTNRSSGEPDAIAERIADRLLFR